MENEQQQTEEPDPNGPSKAIADIMGRLQSGQETDWVHVMRIWTSRVRPKLTGIVDQFLQDAAVHDAAAAVVLMMSAAYEGGRAYQMADAMARASGMMPGSVSMPSAVPPETRLPDKATTIKLNGPATFAEADLLRFEQLGGKIDRNGHRVYVLQAAKAGTAATSEIA